MSRQGQKLDSSLSIPQNFLKTEKSKEDNIIAKRLEEKNHDYKCQSYSKPMVTGKKSNAVANLNQSCFKQYLDILDEKSSFVKLNAKEKARDPYRSFAKML